MVYEETARIVQTEGSFGTTEHAEAEHSSGMTAAFGSDAEQEEEMSYVYAEHFERLCGTTVYAHAVRKSGTPAWTESALRREGETHRAPSDRARRPFGTTGHGETEQAARPSAASARTGHGMGLGVGTSRLQRDC